MPRYCYVNGRFLPHRDGAVHIEDRGYQFADGVYEVVTIANGTMVDEDPHLDRLERSLKELRMRMPMARGAMKLKVRELVRRNGLKDGLVYMQVTRGVAPRNHAFPSDKVPPAIVMTTKKMDFAKMKKFTDGVTVVSAPDIRWGRCDIKTVSLLPNCLAKQAATEAGAYEAWLVDEKGNVTEGSSSNAWIITKDGVLVTKPATNEILNGITRQTILDLAKQDGVPFEEREFTLEEAYEAKEAFVSSATSFVTPVVKIDDHVIGNGHPGSLCEKLLGTYQDYAAGRRSRAA
ncbi:D-amino-acid transaminase [Hwanghaeella grinnelliae]|uniref:D-alanine aminotransferase n=1 Tax=Hwanghaeella grinnelliae TaxID=2500179 RepID=A0A437QXX4_9PROT|nr:D-amino-acid transaminase [Hwanghaeella grinnelliae]RVU39368.1 D-amino-acid transaminase [Hwanghaeella grinnelliae]